MNLVLLITETDWIDQSQPNQIKNLARKPRDVYRTQSNIYDEAFSENSQQLEAINYFDKKAPS